MVEAVKAWAIKAPKGNLECWSVRSSELYSIQKFLKYWVRAGNWDHWKKQGFTCVPVEVREITPQTEKE